MGIAWRLLECIVEGQQERRKAGMALQIVSVVLEEHSLLVLGQFAHSDPVPGGQAARDLKPFDGLKLLHWPSTSSMVRGAGFGALLNAAKRSSSSTQCHSKMNWRKEICPVLSKRLMVGAGTVLVFANAARESLSALRCRLTAAANRCCTSEGVTNDRRFKVFPHAGIGQYYIFN